MTDTTENKLTFEEATKLPDSAEQELKKLVPNPDGTLREEALDQA